MTTTTRKQTVEYFDLLRIPFKVGGRGLDGLDCAGLTRIMLARSGTPAPMGAFPNDYATLEEAYSRINYRQSPEQLFDSEHMPWLKYWQRVSVAESRPGDVAFYCDGVSAHVASIVFRAHGRSTTVLTASESRGVCALPLNRIPDLIGIYRLREDA
jgi:cell wall-associated NlpC family hydrolase